MLHQAVVADELERRMFWRGLGVSVFATRIASLAASLAADLKTYLVAELANLAAIYTLTKIMQVFAFNNDANRSISLHAIQDVVQLQTDEFQECVRALEKAEAIVRDARKLKSILSNLELSSTRYRRGRAEGRILSIIEKWHWYSNWSSGRLFQLFLLPTPDFRFIVHDESRRNVARDSFPEIPIPQAFLKLLKGQPECDSLYQKMSVNEQPQPEPCMQAVSNDMYSPQSDCNKEESRGSRLAPVDFHDAGIVQAVLGTDAMHDLPADLYSPDNDGIWTGSNTQSILQEGNWVPWDYK